MLQYKFKKNTHTHGYINIQEQEKLS